MKKTKFSIGQRWFCESDKYGNAVTFIIIGPGKNSRHKICRLEFKVTSNKVHGLEQDYSHLHLKKYAVLIK